MQNNDFRLNKRLSMLSGMSRRQADDLIDANRVKVNNKPTRLGQRVTENDIISVDGKNLNNSFEQKIILLNKPTGYTCSRQSQRGDKTIYELLPDELFELKPVGRLDKNSSGALLLTNDGDLAFRLTHPKFHKNKTYHISLNKPLEPLHQQMISDYGINLADGRSKLQLMRLSDDNRLEWEVQMHEGRNRQIRRTFDALGYAVEKLHRIDFDGYSINDIKIGDYKIIK